MSEEKSDQPKKKRPDPFLDAWVRRTRKQFSGSGMISQAAHIFAREEGGDVDVWRRRLRSILNGRQAPTLEVLARLDKLAAGKPSEPQIPPSEGELF
ncbi:hypothetical protein JIN85_07005 [Luteolibacter pohnpeiensis]|uniref:Uncharacterized protein n=1 Tax=Luteolibacter pohnpeiensis TaxID=454153 RepID=A0A934VVG5_9BACT|nr:hypothetical protein [Luteolibacter pohnpeiensis]MBK1882155.1 hypothetical protein [Luteolibacter pohnpeiensis]